MCTHTRTTSHSSRHTQLASLSLTVGDPNSFSPSISCAVKLIATSREDWSRQLQRSLRRRLSQVNLHYKTNSNSSAMWYFLQNTRCGTISSISSIMWIYITELIVPCDVNLHYGTNSSMSHFLLLNLYFCISSIFIYYGTCSNSRWWRWTCSNSQWPRVGGERVPRKSWIANLNYLLLSLIPPSAFPIVCFNGKRKKRKENKKGSNGLSQLCRVGGCIIILYFPSQSSTKHLRWHLLICSP